MLTTTRQTKAATIERNISLTACRDGEVTAIVLETAMRKRTSSGETKSYFLRRIPADFGTAYEVERVDGGGEVYHVHSQSCRNGTTCSCPAGTYGKCVCRHVAMVNQAKREGLL